MIRRVLRNNNHTYYTLLTYIDLSVDEPEEFMGRVRALAEELHNGIIVQIMSADNMAGFGHLLEVLIQSLEAERRSCLLAKRVEVDMLLRLACTRQISDAIERVGLRRGRSRGVLVAVIHEGEGNDEGEGGEDKKDMASIYHNILMRFKDELKAVDGVISICDSDGNEGEGERERDGEREREEEGERSMYKHRYEHLTSMHGLSEQELSSCISDNRLVSILAERANLLHR